MVVIEAQRPFEKYGPALFEFLRFMSQLVVTARHGIRGVNPTLLKLIFDCNKLLVYIIEETFAYHHIIAGHNADVLLKAALPVALP